LPKPQEENKKRRNGDGVYEETGHEELHMMSGEEVLDPRCFHPSVPLSAAQEAVANTDALALSTVPFMLDRSLRCRASSEFAESRAQVRA